MIETICRYIQKHRRRAMPLIDKLVAADLRSVARRPGETFDVLAHLDDLQDDPDAFAATMARFVRGREGELATTFGGQSVTRIAYDDAKWQAVVAIDFIGNNRFDLAGLQERLVPAFEPADLETLIELAAGFLAENVGRPFGYELHADGAAFLAGRLQGRSVTVQVLDVRACLKALVFLMRKSEASVLVRSAADVLALAEQGQDLLCFAAEAYEERDLTVTVDFRGENIFRCGKGVKSNLGSRFGPTALQLDAVVRMMMSAMPGRGK